MSTRTKTPRVATKNYRCDCCGKPIKVGMLYWRDRGAYGRSFRKHYICTEYNVDIKL